MRITRVHVEFWRCKKSPEPLWMRRHFEKVEGFTRIAPAYTIDGLVNAHAGKKEPDYVVCAHNTVTLLKSARMRGQMIDLLHSMAHRPQTLIDPEQRQKYCRKWLARILKQRLIREFA